MPADPTGAEIACAAPDLLAEKARMALPRMAALAVLAGALIGFGSIGFLIAQATADPPGGAAQLLSGVAFSTGLAMVMITGAELFTGNTMFVLPALAGRLTPGRLLGVWTLVWLGNLVGALLLAGLFAAAGGTELLDGEVGEAARRITSDKLAKGVLTTLASGVLANMLVCLAVWMAMAAESIPAKVLALIGPVTIFVAAGLEHSVANMSILPIGLLAGAQSGSVQMAANLALSTVGNVTGGAAVALLIAYGHGRTASDVSA